MLNFAGITLHLYGLLIGIGVWLGFEIVQKRIGKQNRAVAEHMLVCAVIGGVIGARLYHVIDYWQRYYGTHPTKIFSIWEGGLGIWGAIVGAIVTVYIYARIKDIDAWYYVNRFALGVPVAQAIGRIGNWVNGELFGKNGEPLFAYEAVLNLLLFAVLFRLSAKRKFEESIFGFYLVGYGLIRIVLEDLRPEQIIWKIGGFPTASIFGVLAIVFGVATIYHHLFRRQS